MSVGEVVLSVPAGGATVNADNPWPGLLAFRETDQGYFQGRQTETEELFRLAMRERLTVLFGLSGLGKSSLLQAGLFPRLRRENVFPVYLRFDFSSGRPDLVAQVTAVIAREATAHQIEAPPTTDGETLWEYFHRDGNNFWNARNRPVMSLLVFDQFEEIFTLGRLDPDRAAATEIFTDQLADLAECRPPAELKARMDGHPEEARAFNFGQHHYKILLGIREDFLPDLESLRARMPAVALNRLRLRRMNGAAALLVVNQAQHLIDSDVAVQVVRFVAADRRQRQLADLEVEPALLSVVCRELNNKRLNLGEHRITARLLEGNQEQVLTDFYERSTADLAPEARFFIEDHLLTVSGYRDSVALENALCTPGVSRHSIDQLVERRLVRREERGGAQRLELTHDLLAGVVRASRDNRRQKQEVEKERLALLQAQEEQQQQAAQEREKRERDQRALRRVRLAAAVFLVLTLAAIGAAVWAFRAQGEADLAAMRAQEKTVEAEKNFKLAESETLAAQSQRESAEKSAALAEKQGTLAEEAAKKARIETIRRRISQAETEFKISPTRGLLLAVEALNASRREQLTCAQEVTCVEFAAKALVTMLSTTGGTPLIVSKEQVSDVSFSADGKLLATADDRVVNLWRIDQLETPFAVLQLPYGGAGTAVSFSGDGKLLATAGFGAVLLWRIDEPPHASYQFPTIPFSNMGYTSVSFSSNGKLVLTASGGGVRVWQLAQLVDQLAMPIAELPGPIPLEPIIAASFISGDESIVTASDMGKVLQWRLDQLDHSYKPLPLADLKVRIEMASFSRDGKYLVIPRQLDTQNREIAAHFVNLSDPTTFEDKPPLANKHFFAQAVTLSSDGNLVAAADDRGLVRVWGLDGNEKPQVLRGHEGPVYAASFSPDGKFILTGGKDETARLWQLPQWKAIATPDQSQNWTTSLNELTKLARKTAGRNLTRKEWSDFFPDEKYHPTFPGLPTPAIEKQQ